jgi:hypothetical protein
MGVGAARSPSVAFSENAFVVMKTFSVMMLKNFHDHALGWSFWGEAKVAR